MKLIAPLLVALMLTLPLQAQEVDMTKRSNHYIDHIVLGVSDLESGMKAFRELTGVSPKKDGQNPQLGTVSAVVGLGENMFLEIMAPDPDADPESVDPDLRDFIYDRLTDMEELTPFKWAVGTSNIDRTQMLLQRSRGRPSAIMPGSRKRNWGREQLWRWLYVESPESGVTPLVYQWDDEQKSPQDRAPNGCEFVGIEINSQNYKTLLVQMTTLQVEATLDGKDEDSLRFNLSCPNGDITFDHVTLPRTYKPRPE